MGFEILFFGLILANGFKGNGVLRRTKQSTQNFPVLILNVKWTEGRCFEWEVVLKVYVGKY